MDDRRSMESVSLPQPALQSCDLPLPRLSFLGNDTVRDLRACISYVALHKYDFSARDMSGPDMTFCISSPDPDLSAWLCLFCMPPLPVASRPISVPLGDRFGVGVSRDVRRAPPDLAPLGGAF